VAADVQLGCHVTGGPSWRPTRSARRRSCSVRLRQIEQFGVALTPRLIASHANRGESLSGRSQAAVSGSQRARGWRPTCPGAPLTTFRLFGQDVRAAPDPPRPPDD